MKNLKEEILDLIPCIHSMCDKHGTTVGGTMDDPEPYQCQFCYEQRFPAADKLTHLFQQYAESCLAKSNCARHWADDMSKDCTCDLISRDQTLNNIKEKSQ